MQQITVTKENGVTLTESKTLGIYSENIVSTKDDGSDTEIVYADTLDRRIKPKVWTVANTKATVDGFISSDTTDLTVYNVVDGTTYDMTIQDKFIKQITDTYAVINETRTACRKVDYVEGAFASKTVYVSNSLASLATAIVTTTTTTAAATTTTTAAATTTTTAAATTTTTAAATTTTTAAATTTTTAA